MPPSTEKPVVFLEGERIYLRPLEMADEKVMRRWYNDEPTRVYLESYWPITESFERKFIEGLGADQSRISLVVVTKKGHRLIGGVGVRFIRWKDRSAEFGITIGEADARGQGYGAEATLLILRYCFRTLNLNRIQLGVWDFNEPAIRSYEKLGFTLEGRQRQHGFVDGRYVDQLIYGMLASEFETLHGRASASAARRDGRRKVRT